MHCAKCGSEIPRGAEFCPGCGAPVSARDEDDRTIEAIDPGSGREARATKSKGVIIAVCIAVVAVIAAGIVWWQSSQRSQADAVAHSQHDVTVGISAPGYTDGTSSKIPLHLTGTDVDGNAVDTIAFVNGEGSGITVQQGSYHLTVVASPILADGTIYTTPTNEIDFTIDSSAKDKEAFDITSKGSFSFTVPDADSVTDDQIAAAAKYATSGGTDDAATATTLKAAATKKRDDAVAAKQKAAAATAAATTPATTTSKFHVVATHYEFDIPEYWQDKVTWAVDGDTVTVYPDLYQMPLVTFSVVKAIDGMGDIGSSIIYYENCSSGILTAREDRYAYICPHESYTDTMADALIDLQTGGRVTYAQALRAAQDERSGGSAGMDQIFFAGDDFFTESIAPSIVLK